MSTGTHPPGSVVTVLGPMDPAKLGRTMMHEHVFVDIRPWCHPPAEHLQWREWAVDQPVSLALLGVLRRDPLINRHNAVLDDEELAVSELRRLADAGAGSLVEMGCVGVDGQRRDLLPQISRRTGLNIVAAAGLYREDHLPDELRGGSVDAAYERLRSEITGTARYEGVAAGVIGEMGTSAPLTDVEAVHLRVAGDLAAEFGLSLHIHLEPSGQEGAKIMEVLAGTPVPPHRVVLGHADYAAKPDFGYIGDLAATGAYLGLDTFGLEHIMDSIGWTEPRDLQRVEVLRWLLDNGYGDRVVVSHDVAFKTCLRSYGGFGYDHFLRDIAPQLRAQGVGEAALDQILIRSPRSLLTVEKPR